MKAEEVIAQAREAMTGRRVFGEPYEKDGITVIPAARIWVGAGGGGGEAGEEQRQGSGSGFGLIAGPAGAFVIKGEQVDWKPAIDVNRIIVGCQVVAVLALLALRARRRGAKR
jgi:uncharacterized spore protein YtfJ